MSNLSEYTGRYWRCEPAAKPKYQYGAWYISRVEAHFSRVLHKCADYLDLMGTYAQMGSKWLRKLDKWW